MIFMLDESYSLFAGGEHGPRFGGAGLQLFLIADELSKSGDFNVSWIFGHSNADLNLSKIQHDFINIIDGKDLEKMEEISTSIAPKVAISSTANATPLLLNSAKHLSAKSILRLSSDTDTTKPRNVGGRRSAEVFDLYAQCDAIVVQSDHQLQQLSNISGINACKIQSLWPSVLHEARTERCQGAILWVASAQVLKQPWYFLDLVRRFPNEKFFMVMPEAGNSNLAEYVQRRKDGLPNLALITKQLSLEEVAEAMLEAKLFVNTSEIEGFPNTFLQAFSAGLPVVSLNIDPDGIIDKYELGINARNEFAALVLGVEKLLSDDEYYNRCSENGLRYLQEHHGMDRLFDWVKLIESVAGLDYRSQAASKMSQLLKFFSK